MKLTPITTARAARAIEEGGAVTLEMMFVTGEALALVKLLHRRTGLSADEVLLGALRDAAFNLGVEPEQGANYHTEQRSEDF